MEYNNYEKALEVARRYTDNFICQENVAHLLSEEKISLSKERLFSRCSFSLSGDTSNNSRLYFNKKTAQLEGVNLSNQDEKVENDLTDIVVRYKVSERTGVKNIKPELDLKKISIQNIPFTSFALDTIDKTINLYNKIQEEGTYK